MFDRAYFDQIYFDGKRGVVPTAITQAATNIGSSTARINGKVSDDGGESCEARFRWRETDTIPGTETLRPNAAGDETSISAQYPDSTYHWDKVDEAVADEASTYVKPSYPVPERDLYNLPAHNGSGIISKVTIYFRVYRSTGGFVSQSVSIKTHGTIYDYAHNTSDNTWQTFSDILTTNPYTGLAWTWDEIDALQIGCKVQSASPSIPLYCTQVYVKVNYTSSANWVTTEWQNTLKTNDEYYEDLTELDEVTEYEFQTQAKNSAGESEWTASAYFKTSLVITPSFVQAIGSVIAPTVVLGSTIATPEYVKAIGQVVAPTVVLGSITATPEHIDALAQVVQPTVFAGSVTLTPAFVASIAQVVQPNVKLLGNIIYSPTPIDAIAKAVSPSVIYGPIIPEPVSAIGSGVNPVVILTSISITPDYIEAIGQVVAPIVSGAGVVYITPDSIEAIAAGINPTVILGSITLTPDALSAIAQVLIGKVKQGNIIFSPAFIKALGKAVSPIVIQGSITLEPESIRAIVRGENPEVILGSTTVTPEFVKALAGVIAPTVLQTWIGRKLRIKIVTSQYRKVDVVTCQRYKVDVVTTQKRKIKTITSGG